MTTTTDTFDDLTIEQIQALLKSKLDAAAQMKQAQTTVLLTEEGGATFLQGIVDRAPETRTARSVGKAWEDINFEAADGTLYVARVWLTDVAAKAALPPAPKKS